MPQIFPDTPKLERSSCLLKFLTSLSVLISYLFYLYFENWGHYIFFNPQSLYNGMEPGQSLFQERTPRIRTYRDKTLGEKNAFF